MKRREFFRGLLGSTGMLTLGDGCAQAQTKELIYNNICAPDIRGKPFSLEYRGVGSIIIKAYARDRSLGIVIPTVPLTRMAAEYVLDLDMVNSVDRLIVCVLHNHYDHAAHVDLFKAKLLREHGNATLIMAEGGKERKGAAVYEDKITPSGSRAPPDGTHWLFKAGVLSESSPGGSINVDLHFIAQGDTFDASGTKIPGPTKRKGHADHWGLGDRCNEERRHCGNKMIARPSVTYCVFGEVTVDKSVFSFFVNDAASAYVAANIAKSPVPKKCDLAMIAIPDGHLAHAYPENLLETLDPTMVRWVHWEGFIADPWLSRSRLAYPDEKPWTAGQLVLPKSLVEKALGEKRGACFPQHGHIEFFDGRRVSE